MARRNKKGARDRHVRSELANRNVIERLETPWFFMERSGKHTAMQRTAPPDVNVLSELFGTREDVAEQLEDKHEELVGLITGADPADLLARASHTYLTIDPYTFDEREETRSPAHVEYLAVQALLYGDWDTAPLSEPSELEEQSRRTFEALEVVQKLFHLRSLQVLFDAQERGKSDRLEADRILKLRLHSMAVRGSGYEPHIHQVLGRIFDKCDKQVQDALGFRPSIYRAVFDACGVMIQRRFRDRASESAGYRAEMQRELKRARRRNEPFFGNDLSETTPTQQKMMIDYMLSSWVLLDSRAMAEFGAADLAAESGHDVSEVAALLEAFTLRPSDCDGDHHRLPFGTLPTTRQPIVRSSTGYLIPAHSTVLEAIRPRIEQLLKEKSAWDAYERARATTLEELAVEALKTALPHAKSWLNISWTSGDQSGELDGLVHLDDLGIRVQCKAGSLTPASRRGAPDRLDEDIKKLIAEASEQHEALDRALISGNLSGLEADQQDALSAALKVDAIVTLDDVSQLATTPDRLEASNYLGSNNRRWIVPIFDLLVICDMLRSERLAHYIVRRLRLHDDGRIVEAHDELDFLGHYIQDRLFFDRDFENSDFSALRLESHTTKFDSYYLTRTLPNPAPKPEIDEAPGVGLLLQRLRRERPRHWISAALVAINGDQQATDQISDFVVSIDHRLREKGWTNATVCFGDLGFTLFIDRSRNRSETTSNMREYAISKMEELHLPNWISVGEGASGGLFVLPLPSPEAIIESVLGE